MRENARDKREMAFAILIMAVIILSFLRIENVSLAMQKGLLLCAVSLIPSLFPFFVLNELLLASHACHTLLRKMAILPSRLFRISETGGMAFLLGALFGFPLGARAVAEGYMRGEITKKEGDRLLLFCNNTGPVFLIGGVGLGMLSSAKIGLLLYLVQLLAAFLCGILSGIFARKESSSPLLPPKRSLVSFSAVMRGAVWQMLAVCGYVLFFSVISALVLPLLPGGFCHYLAAALLEIGSASQLITESLPVSFALPFCGFACCFSGLSVYFQCSDMIRDTPLSLRFYLPVKLLMGILSFFLLSILCSTSKIHLFCSSLLTFKENMFIL